MRRTFVFAALLSLALAGCGISAYRDTIATSYGYLTWAQGAFLAQCQAAPTAPTCSLITRGIGLHNGAVDALDAYCNGPAEAGNAAWNQGGPCAPIKSLEGALKASIDALGPVVDDIKLLATGRSQPKVTTTRLMEAPQSKATLLTVYLEAK